MPCPPPLVVRHGERFERRGRPHKGRDRSSRVDIHSILVEVDVLDGGIEQRYHQRINLLDAIIRNGDRRHRTTKFSTGYALPQSGKERVIHVTVIEEERDNVVT